MINDRGIRIQNIYYMLSYAYRTLMEQGYASLATEEFDGIPDIFATIIERGVSWQIKQGLYRTYVSKRDVLPNIQGRIDYKEMIRLKVQHKRLICNEYDELSVNNILNQIIKTTMSLLLKSEYVSLKNKKNLKKDFLYFSEIETINVSDICWSRIDYGNCNNNYRMLINICRLVLDGLIQNTSDGRTRIREYMDEQSFNQLYERFILQYYRYHYPNLVPASIQIDWNLDDDYSEFLPKMKTDVVLKKGNKSLIIDAKYYRKSMQEHFNVKTVHSANLYQIYSYVKNYDVELSGNVVGMLLYAKTDELLIPNFKYEMAGNTIYVKSLDLSKPFSEVKQQLNDIVDVVF